MTVTVKSENNLGKVVSIQILPVKPVGQGSIEAQYDGANPDTGGWGVYLRHANGMAKHRADFVEEADAVRAVRALCKEHGVPVEQYPWMDSINLRFRFQHAQFLVAETGRMTTRIIVWNNDSDSELYEAVGNPDVRYGKTAYIFRPATVQEAREALNLVKEKAVNQEQNKARDRRRLAGSTLAFEHFAIDQSFIKDVQRYPADHPHYPSEYGHYDTKNARVIWDGAVEWASTWYWLRDQAGLPGEKEIRVTVSGRTGVGKSSLCGYLEDLLKEQNIQAEWTDSEHEKKTAISAWSDELISHLKGRGIKVTIVERNISRHPLDFGTMEIRPESVGSTLPQKLKDKLKAWGDSADSDTVGDQQ